MTIIPGTCSVCGCHGDACRLTDGDKCCWVNAARTVCSAPRCQGVYEARKKESARAARPRKLSSAEVHDRICGRRRRKGRAA